MSATATRHCSCHGVQMYWKNERKRKHGGRFVCAVKKREQALSYIARKDVANSDTVPTALILPIVKDYLENYETHSLDSSNLRYALAPISVLADETKIGERRLRGWIAGERMVKQVPFNFADSLLCAMGKTELWYVEPLAEVYWSVHLPEVSRKRIGTHAA
jgi:hypothetical protein